MSLFRVHKTLIATAIVFFVAFGVRDVATGDGGAGMLLRVAASALGAVALGVYLWWLHHARVNAIRRAASSAERRADNAVQLRA